MLKTYRAPSVSGMFGQYGGRFIPPQLEPYFVTLETAFNQARKDKNLKLN
jgi:tryptophan synthase beta subunit